MQPFLFILGRDDPAGTVGAIVAAAPGVQGVYRRLLRKGRLLREEDVAGLRALAGEQPGLRVSLLRLDEGDLDEVAAGMRLGKAIAGPGIELRGPVEGKVRLVARHNGLLALDSRRLAAVNGVPDVSIYTLFGYTPVAAGTIVAEAKITPLAAPERWIAAAERLARGEFPLIDVLPFPPRKAGLLVRERLDAASAERVAGVLEKKLAWFGSALLPDGIVSAPADAASQAEILARMVDRGADLLLIAGASAGDPLEPIFEAISIFGAEPPRVGVPVHPGSLLWLSWKEDTPIIGIPSCGAISEHTSFDIILPRLLALGRAGLADLDTLGEGGLLARGMEHRFPDYDA